MVTTMSFATSDDPTVIPEHLRHNDRAFLRIEAEACRRDREAHGSDDPATWRALALAAFERGEGLHPDAEDVGF